MKIILFSILTIAMIGLIVPETFAEEMEEKFEIIFDEGDYKLEYENNIILPLSLQVSDHDYKIKPEYFVRFQGKTIDHYTWPNINSGNFKSYILIDRNWSSGIYKINLKYDETFLDPLTFKVYRDSDSQTKEKQVEVTKEKIETKIEITNKTITIPDKPPSWFAFNPLALPLEGQLVLETTGNSLHLKITDPDNKILRFNSRVLEHGQFEATVMLDSTWKSGTYKIIGEVGHKEVFSDEFVIDNPRIKPNEVKKEISYETSMIASGQTAGDFEVLTISGSTNAPSEKLVLVITKPDKSVNEFNINVLNGSYSTDIVLSNGYEAWKPGKYLVNISLDDQILSSMNFEINQFGDAVFPKDTGSMISGSTGELEKLVKLDVGEYETNKFTISGKVDSYTTGSKVSLSIIKPDKTKQEIKTFANSDGEYSIPIVIDNTWPKGEYTIYTTYRDFVDSPVSFTISGSATDVIIDEAVKKDIEKKNEVEIVPQVVSLPHGGGHIDISVEGGLGIDMIKEFGKRFAKIPVILTMPDDTTKQLMVRANEEGNFVFNAAITNDWDEGEYSLSVKKFGEMTKFGIFKLIDDDPTKEVEVRTIVESAMPGSAYEPVDSFVLDNDKVEYHLRSNHITFFGSVADDDLGRVVVTVIKYDDSTEKLYPKLLRDNTFTGTFSINDEWPPGSYEIFAIQGDHEIGHKEFLITTVEQVYVYLDDTATISEDMFLHSKGVELSIKGQPISKKQIVINLEGPDGSVKELLQSSTSASLAGGKVVYSDFNKRITVDQDWVAGTYKATAIQDNNSLGTALIQITPFSPTWLQDQTKLWLDGEITDWQYKNRLRTIAEHGILELPDASDAKTDLPGWLKESAKMYVNDETPQSAYLNSLQYLVDSGLLNASV